MNIEGLDYNTQREKIILPEYGREIQKMVDYAVGLPDKEERQACAESIISIMDRMTSHSRESEDHNRKLWDHLAIMSDFKLDIDYPYDVNEAKKKGGAGILFPRTACMMVKDGKCAGDCALRFILRCRFPIPCRPRRHKPSPGADRCPVSAAVPDEWRRRLPTLQSTHQ